MTLSRAARGFPVVLAAALAFALGCSTSSAGSDADAIDPPDVSSVGDVPPTGDVPADVGVDPGYGYQQDVAGVEVEQAFLPEPPTGKEWRMVFHDEFDGTSIDTARWHVSQGKGRTNVYDPRAVVLDGNGILHMRVFAEDGTYYTGGLDTSGIWQKTKGYFETRVQFQKQGGHWTAFWLYSNGICAMGNGGADGAELDIFERPWTLDPFKEFTQRTIHWDCDDGKTEDPQEIPGISEGFHTMGMWWSDDAYIFYTDGKEIWRSTDGGICETPEYMLLTDEIQDNLWFEAGSIEDAMLPDEWLVDYVRVYYLFDASPSPAASPR